MDRHESDCGICEGDYLAWGLCANNCTRTDTYVVRVSNHESYCFCPHHADLFLHPPAPTITDVLNALDDLPKDAPSD